MRRGIGTEIKDGSFGNLYAEIRYTFVRDLRINNTGFELPMGDLGTTWFYKVPYRRTGNIWRNEEWTTLHASCPSGGLQGVP